MVAPFQNKHCVYDLGSYRSSDLPYFQIYYVVKDKEMYY